MTPTSGRVTERTRERGMFAFSTAPAVARILDDVAPRFLLVGSDSNGSAFVAQSDSESQRANRHVVCLPSCGRQGRSVWFPYSAGSRRTLSDSGRFRRTLHPRERVGGGFRFEIGGLRRHFGAGGMLQRLEPRSLGVPSNDGAGFGDRRYRCSIASSMKPGDVAQACCDGWLDRGWQHAQSDGWRIVDCEASRRLGANANPASFVSVCLHACWARSVEFRERYEGGFMQALSSRLVRSDT